VTGDKKPVGKLSTLNPSAFAFGCGATAPTQAAPEASPRRERSEGGQLSTILEKWPFFALAVASCVVTFVAQKRGEAVAPLEGYPLSSRIGNAAVAYVKYLFNSVYPVNLAVIYPLPKEIPWAQVVGAMMVLAVISWVIWRARRQRPYLLTGWLWYLGMLVPVVGLVQVGFQSMADRYTYLPLIGVFLGAAFGMGDLAVRLRLKSTILILVAVFVLAGCLFATARQLRFWRDGETLFERALAVTKDNPVAQSNLGNVLDEAGQLQEAMKHFREALRLKPDDAQTHNNLGNALLQTGQLQEAMEHFREALRLKPDAMAHYNLGVALAQTGQPQEAMEHFQEALRLKPDDALAHNNLGAALAQTGQPQEAVAQFRMALQLQPDLAAARNNLGDALINFGHVLFQQGQMNQAIAPLQEGLQIRPDNVGACNCLGFIFLRQGQAGEAVGNFQKALELQPNNVEAHKYLAWMLATCPDASVRNGAQAVGLAQQAEQLSGGKDPAIITILAAAYAEAGRFPDALTTAQKALALATTQTNTAVVNALRVQIKCYQAGSPFRDLSLTNTLSSESQP
jgi:Flp pilus assembly protein TadD